MTDQIPQEYVLGIDLGSNSLGWATIERRNGSPQGLYRTGSVPALGSRVFEAATEGDRQSGQEKTRNVNRRQMRHQTRQTRRRAQRLRDVFLLLQSWDLLPLGNARVRIERQKILEDLDVSILNSEWFKKIGSEHGHPQRVKRCAQCHRLREVMPYSLRASALEEKLEKHHLGRALYHLAQRRGFLANSKVASRKEDKVGTVKRGISELVRAMKTVDAPTLGVYFGRHVTPDRERIRGHWTSREEMYEPELKQIWQEQSRHHPDIFSADNYRRLRVLVFDQRPSWFDPNTIGRCDLEPSQRRAPMYLLISQRFRLLQQVNNLRVLQPGELDRPLTPDERQKVIDELELKGDRTFDQIRKVLALPEEHKFNLEPRKRTKKKKGDPPPPDVDEEDKRSGKAKLKGNRTNAAFYKVFGKRWLAMLPEERDRTVEYVYAFEKPEKLREAAKQKWGLEDGKAKKLSEISFETRPAGHSRKAMKKLLPLLENGRFYAEAKREIYPEKFQPYPSLKLLPPVEFAADPTFHEKRYRNWLRKTGALPEGGPLPPALGQIRNPAVMRSLTELRKVINELISRFGKPVEVHIELLRELKNPKSVRQRIDEASKRNRTARDNAEKRIKVKTGDEHPSDEDTRRVLLFDECKDRCVYCGQGFSGDGIYRGGQDVHIDHIVPRSLCPDNTFINLVLCHTRCNNEKGARTPFQAFKGDDFVKLEMNAKAIFGRTARRKLARILMNDEKLKEFLERFSERQLRDSAYASKVAAKYLGYLYGGVYDASKEQRVICTSGEATAELMKAWGLYSVLNDGPTSNGGAVKKNRNDHRHHAVDAIAVALTGQGTIQALTAARWLRHAVLESPWNDFVDSVRTEVDGTVVSHRASKKISGSLHKDTIYSAFDPNAPRENNPARLPRVRKWINELSKKAKDIEHIAEPPRKSGKKGKVREAIEDKLRELGTDDPANLPDPRRPENIDKLPQLRGRHGNSVPIKRVRVTQVVKTTHVGRGFRRRLVEPGKPGANHHFEIFAVLDPKNPEKELGWESDDVVTLLEVQRRIRGKKPIIKKAGFGEHTAFKFSVSQGEILELDRQIKGKPLLSDRVRLTTEERNSGRVRLVVRSISQQQDGGKKIEMVHVNDARPRRVNEEGKRSKVKSADWVTKSPAELFKWHARKVVVSPLGEVTEAHD
ncbi:MAG TPA: type II CRISPR RNA-guided endonuclease Cas9 [Terriglobia bacterium]|nr:type II CRISPR RNA-guided endonuclease Cas9 [Terriglobia bacterium]